MKTLRDGGGLAYVSATTRALVNGEEDVSDWDDEELERGRRRDKRGGWGGKPPKLVASAIHAELVKRKMSKAYDLLRRNTHKAVEVLVEIANDKKVDAATRVKAADIILDRSLGRPTERMKLDVGVEKPWQRLIANAVVYPVTRIVGNDEQARALGHEAQASENADDDEKERDGASATLAQGSNVALRSTDREEAETPPAGNVQPRPTT